MYREDSTFHSVGDPNECNRAQAIWMNSYSLTYRASRGAKVTVAAGLMLLMGLGAQSVAESARPTEHEIKSVFLYKFARYAEWPSETFADSAAPVVISVLGRDPLSDVLAKVVRGKTVLGRPIHVERIDELGAKESCHILYISRSKRRQLKPILAAIERQPLLTVSDIASFARDGGMIGFRTSEERVSLDINPAAAQRAGLRISSRLLKIAKIVSGPEE